MRCRFTAAEANEKVIIPHQETNCLSPMPEQYAVLGNPVSHSKSPLIHAMFAAQTGQDISYEAIEAPLDGFAATVRQLREAGYKGCNVTVPFKHEAFALAQRHTPEAATAHAVNTLLFADDHILGHNTDGIGLVQDIQHNLGLALHGKSVLLMGAGGTAHGVILPLLQAGATLAIANRSLDKAEQLAASFHQYGKVTSSSYAALDGHVFDCVINATSSSLSNALPPLPEHIFSAGALAYDMMYGRQTPFLEFAARNGAATLADGTGMLVEQAAAAFEFWRGIKPDTRPVLARLRT